MRDPLDIWVYGTRIATMSEAYDGRLTLSWTDESQERWREGTRLLSAKLTIGDVPVPALVKNYLDGLLPEGNARTNHAMSAGVYDISMHLHHRRANRRFALDVNGKFLVDQVTTDDLVAEGRSWMLPERRARRVVDTTVAALAKALADIDRSAHPGVSAEAWAIVDERVAAAS